jgi:uncharacterized protein (TIGR02466 family)
LTGLPSRSVVTRLAVLRPIARSLMAGANEPVIPKAGRLVMFPSWLLHQVRPYRGNAERISIAFNLTV